MDEKWKEQRNQIIGLGEKSFKKSYFPELQSKITELESSQDNLKTLFHSITDAIVIHSVNGNMIVINEQAQNLFNITEQEIGSFSIFDFTLDKNNHQELIAIWEEVMSGTPKVIQWEIRQAVTKREIPVQVSINQAIWYGEKVLVAVIRDFSERIKFENELIIAKEKAEQSDRLKTAFLQNMSHEIRTPMNAIIGFSELLNDKELSEEKKSRFIHIIQNSGNQLLAIVSDILTISSIETKQEKINISSCKLNELIKELHAVFSQQANNQNILLRIRPGLNNNQAIILTDQTKITQILTNLINNALKFTPSGWIEFGYTLKNNYLEFFVSDSGIGINSEHLAKIFDRFHQAQLNSNKIYGGNGLGLTISKAFTEMLGGTIWVESTPEKGSTFYFTIPYKTE